MISITALPNIDLQKTKDICRILDDLLSKQQIISGYNWYTSIPTGARLVTFSHMHESPGYRDAMHKDMEKIGYSYEQIEEKTRAKFGCYRWEPDFVFRDNEGQLFPKLCIRPLAGSYLNLAQYPESTLENIPELKNESLIGENEGWEMDLEFKTKDELFRLVKLFLTKSSRKNPDHWPGAYDVPVLLIGEQAIVYAQELPDFVESRRIILIENGNEISFVVNKKFVDLKKNPHYTTLNRMGFIEEPCLGNRAFVDTYVDKE